MDLTLETVWEVLSILPLEQRERFFNGLYNRLSKSNNSQHRVVADEMQTFKDEMLSDEPDAMEEIIGSYKGKTGSEVIDLMEQEIEQLEEDDEIELNVEEIIVGFDYETLFNKVDPQQEGVNEEKSIDRFRELLEEKLSEKFPFADINVKYCDNHYISVIADGNLAEINEQIEEVENETFESLRWIVKNN